MTNDLGIGPDPIDADEIRRPWLPEAEQAVLGALMLDAGALARVPRLERRHFFDVRHGQVFGAVQALAARHEPADVVSVYCELRASGQADDGADLAYVNALAQCTPSATNIERHAAAVMGKAAERDLAVAADKAMSIARGDAVLVDKIDRIQALFAEMARGQVRKEPRPIGQVAIERTAHYEALQAGSVAAGWPTGLDELDRMLGGGLRPGGLYIVAARPSVGKSSLAQFIGGKLARDGLPVLFLSQEMSVGELADRAVASGARIDYSVLLSGALSDDAWHRAADALEDLSRSAMWVDDQGGLTLADIKAKARAVRGLKVLVVDYVQLCSSRLSGENRNAQIEELTRGLKAFAMESGCAVLALSQLNREVEKRASKRPTLADLRDSGAIEQDADVVLFLWQAKDEQQGRRLIGMEAAKNRQGRRGVLTLDFCGSTQVWEQSCEALPATRQGGFE